MSEGAADAACERVGGRYRLVEQVGKGGMAVVWRAFDEVLNRRVAVKLLSSHASQDEQLVGRLQVEAQAAAQLSHPHITAVHDYGQDLRSDGSIRPFVVMELVEGRTLHDAVRTGTPWPAAVTAKIIEQVASALAHAHAHGIVHRDITTANVMLTGDGVKVLDFGIAALLGEFESSHTDRLLGTPAYIAPERLLASPSAVTPAVDVYALGIVFYQLLAGGAPWPATTASELLNAHLNLDPAPLDHLSGVPDLLGELCLRCLAKDPEDRPTAQLLVSLLRTAELSAPVLPRRTATTADATSLLAWVMPGDTGSADRTRSTSSTRRVMPWAIVGAVTATAAAAGLLFMTGNGRGSRDAAAAEQNPPPMSSAEATPQASPPVSSGVPTSAVTGSSPTAAQSGAGESGPSAGYTVTHSDIGPARQIQILFRSGARQSQIQASCDRGVLTSQIKER